MSSELQITKAHVNDAAALTSIAFAAKRQWGYPEAWIAAWRETLTITPQYILQNAVYKAAIRNDMTGFYALARTEHCIELDHLWVLPQQMGCGVGRALFVHAMNVAQSTGATTVEIESDPYAEGFYLKMGARRTGSVRRDVLGQARELPILVFELRSQPASR